jgi:hypothetical protein
MEVEGIDDENVDSNDLVQFMEIEGTNHESVESDDPVQFLEVEGTDHDHESVESVDPEVQERVAPVFTMVCAELGDLIMARLAVRDLVKTRSVCKYLRTCTLQYNSKYFRQRQLEAGVTEVTDWYFPTSRVGGAKSVTSGLEMGAWMGLHKPFSGVLSLPPFTFLPFSLESMVMVVASGGLVCFQKLPPDTIFDPAAYVSSQRASLQPLRPHRTYDFIICNPLTKKWRRLPSITPIAANLLLLKLLVADPKNYS